MMNTAKKMACVPGWNIKRDGSSTQYLSAWGQWYSPGAPVRTGALWPSLVSLLCVCLGFVLRVRLALQQCSLSAAWSLDARRLGSA